MTARLWASLGGAVILAALVVMAAVWLRKDARGDVVREIEKGVSDAESDALRGALDYDACVRAGGLWEFAAGRCFERLEDHRQ